MRRIILPAMHMALVFLLMTSPARGELMLPIYDSDLIGRERIVLARIDPDSLKRGPYESTATLIVRDVLKGPADEKRIDVVIRMTVLLGGYYKGAGMMIDLRSTRKDYPENKIELSPRRGDFIVRREMPDLAEDAIWFLERNGGVFQITRVEEVQPIKFLPYFKALLSDDPDRGLSAILKDKDPDLQFRALRHLRRRHRPSNVERVAPLVGSADEKVRTEAIGTLAEIADASSVPRFRKLLEDPDGRVRAQACTFLCRFGDLDSLDAIAKALSGMNCWQRRGVAATLARLDSREVVPILLPLLDDDGTAGDPPDSWLENTPAWQARRSLGEITGIEFPLDATRGRALWEKVKEVPAEVLLRKTILADIERLSDPDYHVNRPAHDRLLRIANIDFDPTRAFHQGVEGQAARVKSQQRWRRWAEEHITDSRLDWMLDGFRAADIQLPRPMTRGGIDLLIDRLRFYGSAGREVTCHNINLLLERFTGHTEGYSPAHQDLPLAWDKPEVLVDRWVAWWKAHRDEVELKPWPKEMKVTREMLKDAPDFAPGPCPLELTISPTRKVYAKGQQPVIHVVVRNVSKRALTLPRRPRGLRYNSRTGSGSAGHDEGAGGKQEDWVTLKPGETIEWTDNAAFGDVGHPTVDLRYEMHYPLAGRTFGHHAWRGILRSNAVSYRFAD